MLLHPKEALSCLQCPRRNRSALTKSRESISDHIGLSSYVDTCEIILLQGELPPPYLGRLGCLEVRQVLMIGLDGELHVSQQEVVLDNRVEDRECFLLYGRPV